MTRPAPGDVLPGTLDMLILKTISLGERMHGYAIADFLQKTSNSVVCIEEGALYPALHKLELRGWLKAEWGVSDNNRRAKFYELTAQGRKELQREATSWERMAAAIARIMDATS